MTRLRNAHIRILTAYFAAWMGYIICVLLGAVTLQSFVGIRQLKGWRLLFTYGIWLLVGLALVPGGVGDTVSAPDTSLWFSPLVVTLFFTTILGRTTEVIETAQGLAVVGVLMILGVFLLTVLVKLLQNRKKQAINPN